MLAVNGGSGLVSQLCAVSGASNTLLEASVPYSRKALEGYLGVACSSYCQPAVAGAMAVRAFQRAWRLSENKSNLFGLGCTASLSSGQSKRGDHRIYMALQTEQTTLARSIILDKGSRSRSEEEALTASLCLNGLAFLTGQQEGELSLSKNETLLSSVTPGLAHWSGLFTGQVEAVNHLGQLLTSTNKPRALLCGSFNPLHEGHLEMVRCAKGLLGHPVDFELCIDNLDKLVLDYHAIKDRLSQFPKQSVWLTNAPAFVEKCRLFPRTTFLVGTDTLARIGSENYYSSSRKLKDSLAEIASLECDFLVYGRVGNQGFVTLNDLKLPAGLARLCRQVPEQVFRNDLSSSDIRNQKEAS